MNNDELLEITTEIGWRLLQSGAEIYRVEESIRRMLEAYGFPEAEVFSIPSCIIVTINDETGHALTRLKRNRSSGLDFDRIDQLNNLCRHICAETPELPVIQQKLAAIMDKKDYSFWTNMFFTASISASFTLFYGGFFPDSIASFFIGILLFLLLSLLGNFHTNSFFQNIFGSALVAGFSLWTTAMGWTVRYEGHSGRRFDCRHHQAGRVADGRHRYRAGCRYRNFHPAILLPRNLMKRRRWENE